MIEKTFTPNERVRIVADSNFSNEDLEGSVGVVVSSKGYFVDVLVTSGKLLGKTFSFLNYHLRKEAN